MVNFQNKFGFFAKIFAIGVMAIWVSACTAPNPQGIYDPNEAQNRRTHVFNRNLDQKLIKPLSTAYGTSVPGTIRQGVGNFASNLNLPSVIVNDLLQLRLGLAAKNTLRFAFNTTVGFGGILDPASDAGIYEEHTDFGETLNIWGMPEGSYVELPLLGPSTERDTIGMIVDVFSNPLTFGAPSPEKYMSPVVKGFAKLDSRYRFANTIDSVLYESADSYAQARLIYLQSRRFQLGQTADEGADDDPYADPYE